MTMHPTLQLSSVQGHSTTVGLTLDYILLTWHATIHTLDTIVQILYKKVFSAVLSKRVQLNSAYNSYVVFAKTLQHPVLARHILSLKIKE